MRWCCLWWYNFYILSYLYSLCNGVWYVAYNNDIALLDTEFCTCNVWYRDWVAVSNYMDIYSCKVNLMLFWMSIYYMQSMMDAMSDLLSLISAILRCISDLPIYACTKMLMAVSSKQSKPNCSFIWNKLIYLNLWNLWNFLQ